LLLRLVGQIAGGHGLNLSSPPPGVTLCRADS
jgi:hypothetical protein